MARNDQNESNWQPGKLDRVRSTPLLPSVWMTSVLVWATVVALMLQVPIWAEVFLCTLTGISFVCFLACYMYLFVNDRDALRAERWRERLKNELPHESPASPRPLSAEEQGALNPARSGLAPPTLAAGEQEVNVNESGRVRKR